MRPIINSFFTTGYVLLSGAVIWQVIIYLFNRWREIMLVDVLPNQSIYLLLTLAVFTIYSVLILLKNWSNNIKLIYVGLFLILLVAILKIIFHTNIFKQLEPYELIYVVNEINVYVFFMCLFHIINNWNQVQIKYNKSK